MNIMGLESITLKEYTQNYPDLSIENLLILMDLKHGPEEDAESTETRGNFNIRIKSENSMWELNPNPTSVSKYYNPYPNLILENIKDNL